MDREMYGFKTRQRRREEAGVNLVSLSVFLIICAAVVVHVSGDSTTVNYNTTQSTIAFTTIGPTPQLYNPNIKNSLPGAPGSETPGGSTNQSISSNSSSSVIPTGSLPANDTLTTGGPTTIPETATTAPAIVVPPTTSLPTTTTRLPTITTRLPTTTARLPTTTTSIPTKGLKPKGLPTNGFQSASFNATGPSTATPEVTPLVVTQPPTTHQNTTVPLGTIDSNTTSLASSKSPTTPAVTSISSQTHSTPEKTTIPALVQPTFETATTKVFEQATETPQHTNNVNVTQAWNHAEVTVAARVSGSPSTSSLATSIVFDTSVVYVTDYPPADITAGKETTPFVTKNVTPSVNGTGLNPNHEKDELRTLLLIVGCSIGGAVTLILLVFIVVYRVAKKRSRDKNSRYYNFKKKSSRPNYEKVLHLQEYCGELDTDVSSAGTGAGWVFQENDQDASKTITLELTPKDKNRPANRSGKPKSRNKNKNNINKSTSRGNYQVLAELYPTRNIPPDVLLSADCAAVNSNSEDEEGAVHETSFSAVTTPSDDKSDRGSVITDGLASKNSFNDGVMPVWPTWNTSPYVKITQDDAVVEL